MLGAITVEQITGVLGLAGLAGGALAVIKTARVQATIAVLGTANDDLRKVVTDEKAARESDRRDCDRELAVMRGKVEVLTTAFGREIAKAIADEWRVMRAEREAREAMEVARPDIARRQAFRQQQGE